MENPCEITLLNAMSLEGEDSSILEISFKSSSDVIRKFTS
jgi:hypothetical protein